MTLILIILFLYFLFFQFILSITSTKKGIPLFINTLAATISTSFVLLVMTIPLFIIIYLANFFSFSLISTTSFFLLLKIFFVYTSILFFYELTVERFVLRLIRKITSSYLSFWLMIVQFLLGIGILSFSTDFFLETQWALFSIILLTGIDAYLNYILDVVSGEEKE